MSVRGSTRVPLWVSITLAAVFLLAIFLGMFGPFDTDLRVVMAIGGGLGLVTVSSQWGGDEVPGMLPWGLAVAFAVVGVFLFVSAVLFVEDTFLRVTLSIAGLSQIIFAGSQWWLRRQNRPKL